MKKLYYKAFGFALIIFVPVLLQAQCIMNITTPIASDTTICIGDTVNLAAFGSCNYLMYNDFNNGTIGSGWASNAGPMFSNPCNPSADGTIYLWIGPATNFPREVTTIDFSVTDQCQICFDMKYASQSNSSPCEGPDTHTEGVHLQYSTNGGSTWTDINYWDPYPGTGTPYLNWANYCEQVPAAAASPNTRFRWFQNVTSGNGYDHWGLDNVEISCPYGQNVTWSHGPTVLNPPPVAPTTTTLYVVVVMDSLGNFAADSVLVNVLPSPTADFTVISPICTGQNSTITYTGSAPPAANYVWDFAGGTVVSGSGAGPYQVNWPASGTYTVSLVVDNGGCPSLPYTMDVEVAPPINVIASINPDTICGGSPVTLDAAASGGDGGPYTFTWDNGIGVSNPPVTDYPPAATTYIVTVTDNCGSPPGIDSVSVNVYPEPIIKLTANPSDGCAPLNVTFSETTNTGLQSWSWDFGDPGSGIQNTSSSATPSHTYSSPGTYDVSLDVVTDKGCPGSITEPSFVTVHPNPTANFTPNPSLVTTEDPTIYFMDQSTNADIWAWDFGDPNSGPLNTSNLQNPSHVYMGGVGTYLVTLFVESIHGCADSTSRQVTVEQEYTFYAPNAFTPNNDGINDTWFPSGIGINMDYFELRIFDRWGKQIYASKTMPWDGKIQGTDKAAPQGVYSWVIQLKETSGVRHKYTGRLTLFR